jgi:demethylmenaquinone methyltransferase/2-methoxy-6-polyprenyl-1,4-benzoquinol methylase
VKANRPKPDDSSPAGQKRLFSAIARRYDFLNHLLSLNIDRRWRRKLVDFAGAEEGQSILDVCTGTGDLAIHFAKANGQSKLWGVDQSQEMLLIARRKINHQELNDRIKLFEANALELPFQDDSFDIVGVAFGLRNIGQHRRAIREMARVLKKGGRLLILEFSLPGGNLFSRTYRFYLNNFIQAVGGIISGSSEAYHHLSCSIAEFPKPEEIVRLMEEEKLKNIRLISLTGGIVCIYRGEK